ncbi:protein adenylyltransferase SelO [Pseudoroseicyclus tamaricis]|uniref:Protein nucleotidyltransferase YdiU n=1 Tax=Pseudoroseicyclus tamaricis TaxID=2705421 RepID=A0A6B2JM61_9RHOB|nr:YdiU family protein [Pseudoroseicyclus tamaricis]NDV02673.1 YdiU family protein [Pseudoroseicyclus tamaricis]
MSEAALLPKLENSFAAELEGAYLAWEGAEVPRPEVLLLNEGLARELGFEPAALRSPEGAAWLTGVESPPGASLLAMAYAGHQFGQFNPQLGDGRALLLGEVVTSEGRRDLHLKGSGRTPFARGGDGKAVLGPVLREYVMGEAMAALGVPTTRALAVTTTGEDVQREGPKPGAVLARVAASHIRVGTFQFFAAREQEDMLAKIANYAIARHDPDLTGAENRHMRFLRRVVERQAELIAQWMSLGFIHGVMNTDNMAISGETIDYGPCAFMEAYDPATVFSSIDHMGRYAYGNQPGIAQWNLARLAEALLPLLGGEAAIPQVTEEVNRFAPLYEAAWLSRFRGKLGLETAEEGDMDLITGLLAAARGQADFTNLFRALGEAARGDSAPVRALFAEPGMIDAWLPAWMARLEREAPGAAERMERVNPLYIPRNRTLDAALTAAEAGDLGPVERLLAHVTKPFTPVAGAEDMTTPAPAGDRFVTYCGT